MEHFEQLWNSEAQDVFGFTDPFLTVVPNQFSDIDCTDFSYNASNNPTDYFIPVDGFEDLPADFDLSQIPRFADTQNYFPNIITSSPVYLNAMQPNMVAGNNLAASPDLTAVPESQYLFNESHMGSGVEQLTYIPAHQQQQFQDLSYQSGNEVIQPSYITSYDDYSLSAQADKGQSYTESVRISSQPTVPTYGINENYPITSHVLPSEQIYNSYTPKYHPSTSYWRPIDPSQFNHGSSENRGQPITYHTSHAQNNPSILQAMDVPKGQPPQTRLRSPSMLENAESDYDSAWRPQQSLQRKKSVNDAQHEVVSISRTEYESLLKLKSKTQSPSTKIEEPKVMVLPTKQTKARRLKAFDKHTKDKENARSKNIRELNAARYYVPYPQTRQSWKPNVSAGFCFNYTNHGELDPETKLPPRALEDFIYHHPWRKTLTLWVQNVPADSAGRYLTRNSSKCRFDNCPVLDNVIKTGEHRVALDEWSWHEDHFKFNPFHVAGYVHLFCLEKNLDFPALCKTGLVKGDTRMLPEGRNKMAITRDHASMAKIVDDFIEESEPWGAEGREEDWFLHSLTRKLTKEHLLKQTSTRQDVRAIRGGNSIDKHLNNLDVRVTKKAELARTKSTQLRNPLSRPTTNSHKRKYPEPEEDSELEYDEDVLEVDKTRTTKKVKKENGDLQII